MKSMLKVGSIAAISLLIASVAVAQVPPQLTLKQIMNAMITPATNTIWGAYQLETEAQWQTIENAALTVIAAGNLMALGGSAPGESELAQQAQWRQFNEQMIAAAREVLVAVAARDEEALSAAGNNALYPPCESCHQQYQQR
ncbi:MAG: hypothetical protein RL839_01620 [Gammaproteobacteria bacterium]